MAVIIRLITPNPITMNSSESVKECFISRLYESDSITAKSEN